MLCNEDADCTHWEWTVPRAVVKLVNHALDHNHQHYDRDVAPTYDNSVFVFVNQFHFTQEIQYLFCSV